MPTMTSTAPTTGTRSPWGAIDNAHTLIDGLIVVGTPSHGGVWVSPERRAQMPSSLRLGSKAWYEEDCEAALVLTAFARELELDAAQRVANRALVAKYFPAQWDKFMRAERPLIVEAMLRSPKLGMLGGTVESKRKKARQLARAHQDGHALATEMHSWSCFQLWQNYSVGSAVPACDSAAHIDALAELLGKLESGETARPLLDD